MYRVGSRWSFAYVLPGGALKIINYVGIKGPDPAASLKSGGVFLQWGAHSWVLLGFSAALHRHRTPAKHVSQQYSLQQPGVCPQRQLELSPSFLTAMLISNGKSILLLTDPLWPAPLTISEGNEGFPSFSTSRQWGVGQCSCQRENWIFPSPRKKKCCFSSCIMFFPGSPNARFMRQVKGRD